MLTARTALKMKDLENTQARAAEEVVGFEESLSESHKTVLRDRSKAWSFSRRRPHNAVVACSRKSCVAAVSQDCW